MASRSLVVVSAGLSRPSATRLLADRLAEATRTLLRDAGFEPQTRVVELRDHAQDLASNLVTGFAPARLGEQVGAVAGADGLIAVTPIFNASYSGLFKTFFDVLERDSLAGVPVLIAATGGTPRHSLALEHAMRPLFAYLGASVVPTAVYAATEDWGATADDMDGGLAERIARASAELARAVAAMEPRSARDPFAEPVPFEELLGGFDAGRAPRDRG